MAAKRIAFRRLTAAGVGLIFGLLLPFNACPQIADSYLARLKKLAGTPYNKLNCSAYLCAARRHSPCSAAGIYAGCDGDLEVVAEVASLRETGSLALRPGDIIAFHGEHVAAYVGAGMFMDSAPEHDGVGMMKPGADRWFDGPIRVLRWKTAVTTVQPR